MEKLESGVMNSIIWIKNPIVDILGYSNLPTNAMQDFLSHACMVYCLSHACAIYCKVKKS